MSRSDSDPADERTSGDVDAVESYEGVTYAERDAGEMKLDLFVPETDAPPLVVYVHGGGWAYATRANTPDLERYAAEWGFAFASVSYRLAPIPDDSPFDPAPDNPTPRGIFPAQILDVKAAIRWLRANAEAYGFDADDVGVWGASAGGHLAALAGTLEDVSALGSDVYPAETVEKRVAADHSGRVQAVVDWYGVSDLRELDGAGLESLLLGGPVSDNPEKARLGSPISHVSATTPPFLVMHGRADEVVPVAQTELLAEALADAHVDATVYALQDLGHVFGADSERSAMERLTGSPRPAQSVTATAHFPEGESGGGLAGVPPADPAAIERFLDRTIRTENPE
ncbi:Dipeptidyl aminopeptidase/acylaminoacyl-peptidase [Halorhabdus sp. SVX81]|uniref:alpha/beta hydrolase n=1 Tax=Halorhabdus sp. SVX81 TaxID=2978283 RepID=UPI0023DC584D|nr:alpha/beta hydrolase [Halorhabdus sp. SVX81]WEL17522.1 Dipeptidyl aminopeptidase/acylaminoacyl-peptidase [Halorhabdus sp. SVX81]